MSTLVAVCSRCKRYIRVDGVQTSLYAEGGLCSTCENGESHMDEYAIVALSVALAVALCVGSFWVVL